MIKTITLLNFRGQKETTLHFGPGINQLTGPNEAGKTTVGHAIAFGFYGTDLATSSRGVDHLITFGNDKTEVVVVTDKATFKREKRRGQTSKIRVGLSNLPLVDADQTSLTQKLGVTPEVFSSCFNVGYFMRLNDEKRMDVISQVVKLDKKAILYSLLPSQDIPMPRVVKLINLRQDAQNVALERRKKQNELAADVGAKEQVEISLREMITDAGHQNLSELDSKINQLEAKQELFRLYQQELNAYKLATAKASLTEESNKRISAERQRLEVELKALGNQPNMGDLERLKQELDDEEQKDRECLSRTKPMPLEPALPELHNEATCLRCGQVVTEKMRATVTRERENIINNYNKVARETADHNKAVMEEWTARSKMRDQKHQYWQTKMREAETWQSSHNQLVARIKALVPASVTVPEPPIKPVGDEQGTTSELQNLLAKKHTILQLKSRYDANTRRKQDLESAIETKTKEVETLRVFEKALDQLPETEVRHLLDKLSMDGVVISLAEGKLVVTDTAMVPYECLSTGRRMRVDLEISKTLQKLMGKRAPGFFFIDDYDLLDGSVIKHLPRDSQIFVAKVSSEATGLEVLRL